MDATAAQIYIRPMVEKTKAFYMVAFLAALGTTYWLYYCVLFLVQGHVLSGTSSYGAVWGITVANVVHVIGISHVGIAISATVRVLNLRRYRNVARMAEFVTLVALITAVFNIGLDVGRPDRFLTHTLLYGQWQAPMVWSMTVITLYLLASSAYLYLTMRRDFWLMSGLAPKGRGIYRMLSLGYEDTQGERNRHEHTLFWLAICLIPIMISVHSVYGLFFGMLPGKGGWSNPLQAPYFVLGAIVSGFSAVIVVAAVLRWVYSWKEIFPDRIFKVFGIFLAFVVFLYLYFMLAEQLTAQYSNLHAEHGVSTSLLSGEFSRVFWLTTIFGLILPFTYLFIQGVRRNYTSVALTTVAAVFINIALWIKRFLIVVPGYYQHHLPLPRPLVPYEPTYAEVVVTFGSYAFAILAFVLLMGLVPMVEMPVEGETVPSGARRNRSGTRGIVMFVTLLAGLLLIAWGISNRNFDYYANPSADWLTLCLYAHAPVKWLLGLALLVAIPLERCLIQDRPAADEAAVV